MGKKVHMWFLLSIIFDTGHIVWFENIEFILEGENTPIFYSAAQTEQNVPFESVADI